MVIADIVVTNLNLELRKKDAEITSWHEKDLASQKLIQSLDTEKRGLANQLIKKQEQITLVTEEAEKTQESLIQVRQELRAALIKINELQSSGSEIRSNVTVRERELEQLQKSNEWLNSELKRCNTQFSEYRAEKVADRFILEMNAQKRVTELQDKKISDLLSRNKDLDVMHRENQLRSQARLQELAEVEAELRIELGERIEQVNGLQSEVDRLRKELDNINSNPLSLQATETMGEFGASAIALAKIESSGKTLTEIVSEYHDIKLELMRSKHEKKKLKELVDAVMDDLKQRGPMIEQYKVDRDRYSEDCRRLTEELSAVIQERNRSQAEVGAIKAAKDELQAENLALVQETRDLGRQVQALIRQVELARSGYGSGPSFDESPRDNLNGLDADTVISERLVVFRNIEELQTHNQQMRKALRDMTRNMEQLAAQQAKTNTSADKTISAELDDTRRKLEIMQEELRQASLQLETVTNERDQWHQIAEARNKSMAAHSAEYGTMSRPLSRIDSRRQSDATENNDRHYQELYEEAKRELEIFRTETNSHIDSLNTQLKQISQEKSNLSIEISKMQSQKQFNEERNNFFSSKLAMQEHEASELRKRLQIMTEQSGRQDARTQELSNAMMEARIAADTLRSENQHLKVEREVWKASESRALKEVQDLMRERNSANERLNDIQLKFTERESAWNAEKLKLDERLEVLIRELQVVRKQHADAMDELRGSTLQHESVRKDLQLRCERLNIDLEKCRGELALAKSKEENLTAKSNDLATRLAIAEQRVAQFEGRNKDGQLLAQQTDQQKIRELELELAQAKSQIEQLDSELKELGQQNATYRGISQVNEQRLAEMNDTYNVFKSEMEQNLALKQAALDALQSDYESLASQLESAKAEAAQMEQRLTEERASHLEEKQILENRIQNLEKSEELNARAQAELSEDVNRHKEESRKAQENYEREIIAHSNAIQTVSSLRKSLSDAIERAATAEADLAAARSNLESTNSSHAATRAKLEEQIQELDKRIQDLTEQNNLLHSQFDQMSQMAHRSIADSGDINSIESSTLNDQESVADQRKTLDDLREVIRFLRREKSILETRLEVASQESQRLAFQMDHTQRSLDETRAVLEEERQLRQDSLASEEKNRELLQKIEHANLLRESNITLRNQVEKDTQDLRRAEQALTQAYAELAPLKERVAILEAEIESRKAENISLSEDNARWRARTQQILQKYERIDPEEHNQLKLQISSLSATRDKAVSDYEALRTLEEQREHDRQAAVAQLNTQIAELRAALEQHTRTIQEKDAVIAEKTKELASAEETAAQKMKDLILRSNEINHKVRDLKDKAIAESRTLRAKLDETIQESTLLKAKHDEHIAEARAQAVKEIDAKWESRHTQAVKQIERFKAEIAQLQQQTSNASTMRAPGTNMAGRPPMPPASPSQRPAAGLMSPTTAPSMIAPPSPAKQATVTSVPVTPQQLATTTPLFAAATSAAPPSSSDLPAPVAIVASSPTISSKRAREETSASSAPSVTATASTSTTAAVATTATTPQSKQSEQSQSDQQAKRPRVAPATTPTGGPVSAPAIAPVPTTVTVPPKNVDSEMPDAVPTPQLPATLTGSSSTTTHPTAVATTTPQAKASSATTATPKIAIQRKAVDEHATTQAAPSSASKPVVPDVSPAASQKPITAASTSTLTAAATPSASVVAASTVAASTPVPVKPVPPVVVPTTPQATTPSASKLTSTPATSDAPEEEALRLKEKLRAMMKGKKKDGPAPSNSPTAAKSDGASTPVSVAASSGATAAATASTITAPIVAPIVQTAVTPATTTPANAAPLASAQPRSTGLSIAGMASVSTPTPIVATGASPALRAQQPTIPPPITSTPASGLSIAGLASQPAVPAATPTASTPQSVAAPVTPDGALSLEPSPSQPGRGRRIARGASASAAASSITPKSKMPSFCYLLDLQTFKLTANLTLEY
eukprot:jgi/Hompol1/6919/HPOL_000686-RA